jgi:hypothetical protein
MPGVGRFLPDVGHFQNMAGYDAAPAIAEQIARDTT